MLATTRRANLKRDEILTPTFLNLAKHQEEWQKCRGEIIDVRMFLEPYNAIERLVRKPDSVEVVPRVPKQILYLVRQTIDVPAAELSCEVDPFSCGELDVARWFFPYLNGWGWSALQQRF